MESENQRVKFLDVGHGDSSVICLLYTSDAADEL